MAIVMNASVELEVFGSNLFVACLTSLRVGSRLSHISMLGDCLLGMSVCICGVYLSISVYISIISS